MRLSDHNKSRADADTMPDDVCDAELMRGVINRDASAMERLYDRYCNPVYAICLRILKNASDAEETVADIFMEVWRKPKHFDVGRGKLLTYLMVLSRSRAIDHLRKRGLHERGVVPDGTAHLQRQSSNQQNPLEICSLAERRQLARQALNSLTAAQREAVHLAFFEGLTHREIAQRINTPIGTVKTRIRLGMIRFRDEFQRVATRSDATTQPTRRIQPPNPPAQLATVSTHHIPDLNMIRVLLADDHDVFREGLAALLEDEPDIQVVGQACDGHAAVQMTGDMHPDVVLMDVTMPGLNGIEATRQIADRWSSVRIIGLSMHDPSDMSTAMRSAGAETYISKKSPSKNLIDTIHRPSTSR